MSSVRLRYWAGAKAAAGIESETWTAPSIAAALEAAQQQRGDPEFDRVLGVCAFLVGGVAVHRVDLDNPVDDLVEVDVLPPFAGGAR